VKKLTQTILLEDPQGRQGNCWQTAIASVLDLELEEVPHFAQIDVDDGEHWWIGTWNWLQDRDMTLTPIRDHLYNDEYYLVTGPSPRNPDLAHVVVYQNGMMVHDPHPDGTGVLEVKHLEVIRKKD
jgi:hypothetical protein